MTTTPTIKPLDAPYMYLVGSSVVRKDRAHNNNIAAVMPIIPSMVNFSMSLPLTIVPKLIHG